jgi:hypothetical protein
VQLEVYELFAPGYHSGPADWLFGGSSILELKGTYGTYTYYNMRDGIILYDYKLKDEYALEPVLAPVVVQAAETLTKALPALVVP